MSLKSNRTSSSLPCICPHIAMYFCLGCSFPTPYLWWFSMKLRSQQNMNSSRNILLTVKIEPLMHIILSLVTSLLVHSQHTIFISLLFLSTGTWAPMHQIWNSCLFSILGKQAHRPHSIFFYSTILAVIHRMGCRHIALDLTGKGLRVMFLHADLFISIDWYSNKVGESLVR